MNKESQTECNHKVPLLFSYKAKKKKKTQILPDLNLADVPSKVQCPDPTGLALF